MEQFTSIITSYRLTRTPENTSL